MDPVRSFREHVRSVERLMNFDRDVLDFALDALRELKNRLETHHHLDNPHLTAARTIEMLQGIRDHDSLRNRYQTVFNQALVLLVSYFASSVHDVFRQGVADELARETDSSLLKEQVKISFRELRDVDFQVREIAPDLLVQTKDISFQDMQSIARAFKDVLGVTIDRTDLVNEIILAQGCRHVIVHAGGVVDEKLLRQVAGAKPRTLKPELRLGQTVQFSVEEVSRSSQFMVSYLEQISEMLRVKRENAA